MQLGNKWILSFWEWLLELVFHSRWSISSLILLFGHLGTFIRLSCSILLFTIVRMLVFALACRFSTSLWFLLCYKIGSYIIYLVSDWKLDQLISWISVLFTFITPLVSCLLFLWSSEDVNWLVTSTTQFGYKLFFYYSSKGQEVEEQKFAIVHNQVILGRASCVLDVAACMCTVFRYLKILILRDSF